jgi:hypothetical protein
MGAVNGAYGAWQIDRRPRQCLIALLAYHEGDLGPMPEEISASRASATPLRTRLKHARDQYTQWVQTKNNGIREPNVLRLLLPTGVLESDLDPGWLQTIDGFGNARGDTAHQALRTQQPPDPATEHQTVAAIVAGLRKVDARLTELAM